MYIYRYIYTYVYPYIRVATCRAVPGQNENSCQNDRPSRAKYMRLAVPAVPCQLSRASCPVPSFDTPTSVSICSLTCCAS